MKNLIIIIILGLISFGCSSNKKSEDKDIAEITKPNTAGQIPGGLKERTLSSKDGIIFGSRKNTESSFAANNILWRASLNTLDFTPLNSANYAGGIIVTDWYNPSQSQLTSIKITVKFFSSDIKTSSIEVDGFERNCVDSTFKCSIKKTSIDFNQKIKNRILLEARKLSLQKIK